MRQSTRGGATRERILRRAVQLASVEGLNGLTVGRLARALGLSKAGLFAHFGSKEALQVALIEEARRSFVEKVLDPSEGVPEGLPRLFALQTNWIAYLRDATFKGGCFFAAASAEFDGRPGPVRTRIAALAGQWRQRLEIEARRARDLGHIGASIDPARIAFLLHAISLETNWAHQLLADDEAFEHALGASEDLLRRVATEEGVRATKARRVVPASPNAAA